MMESTSLGNEIYFSKTSWQNIAYFYLSGWKIYNYCSETSIFQNCEWVFQVLQNNPHLFRNRPCWLFSLIACNPLISWIHKVNSWKQASTKCCLLIMKWVEGGVLGQGVYQNIFRDWIKLQFEPNLKCSSMWFSFFVTISMIFQPSIEGLDFICFV